MLAVDVIGCSNTASTLAPSTNLFQSSSSKECCSISITDGPSICVRLVTLSDDGHAAEDADPLLLALDSNWRKADVLAVQIAHDEDVMLLYTWVVVFTREVVPEGTSNAWIGRFEGSILQPWMSCCVPHVLNEDDASRLMVQVLDGPVFIFDTGRNLVRVCRGATATDVVLSEAGLSSERMLCPLTRGIRRQDVLCVGHWTGNCSSKSQDVLLAISGKDGAVRMVGELEHDRNGSSAEQIGSVQCAAADVYSNTLYVAWSAGCVSRHMLDSGNKTCSGTLGAEAGCPVALSISECSGRVFISCIKNESSVRQEGAPASMVREDKICKAKTRLWAVDVSATPDFNIVPCFEKTEWNGVLGDLDFLMVHEIKQPGFQKHRTALTVARYPRGESNSHSRQEGLSFTRLRIFESGDENSDQSARPKQVESRLRTRLEKGIYSLLEAGIAANEKRNMAQHARGLLSSFTRKGPFPKSSTLFCKPLKPAVDAADIVEADSDDALSAREQLQKYTESDTLSELANAASSQDQMVRLLRIHHFVDSTGCYIVVAADVIVLQEEALNVGTKGPLKSSNVLTDRITSESSRDAVWLEPQIGNDPNPVWEAVSVQPRKDEFRTTLVARVNLYSLVNACAGGLSDLVVGVRAVAADDREQLLTTFQMDSSIFARDATKSTAKVPSWCADAYAMYAEHADIVARGECASELHNQTVQEDNIAGGLHVNVAAAGNVARIRISAPSGVAMASTASKLLENAADDVQFTLAPLHSHFVASLQSSASSLKSELEQAGLLLNKQGMTAEDFTSLLKLQIATEEEMGVLLESAVGLL